MNKTIFLIIFFLVISNIYSMPLEKIGKKLTKELLKRNENKIYRVLVKIYTDPILSRNSGNSLRKAKIYENYGNTVQKDILKFIEKENIILLKKLPISNVIVIKTNKKNILKIAERIDVEKIIIDRKIKLVNPPIPTIVNKISTNDIYYDGMIWSLKKMEVPQVWRSLGFDGAGVTAGVIDTGLNSSLSIFSGKIAAVFNSAAAPGASTTDVTDEIGHGTHVSGTIVGGVADDTVYEEKFGVYIPKMKFKGNIGVAPGAKLCFSKIFSGDGAYFNDEIEGLEWCAKRTRVINASIGSDNPQHEPDLLPFYKNILDTGVILVYAAGNETLKVGTPQDIPEIITVGAIDHNYNIADFSNFGPAQWGSKIYVKPDVAAPGVQVLSYYKDKLEFVNGTSMAAPNAAAVITLMLSINPNLKRDDIHNILKKYCVDKGLPGNDIHFGYGFMNAYILCKKAYNTLNTTAKIKQHLKMLRIVDKRLDKQIERYEFNGNYYYNFILRETNIKRIISIAKNEKNLYTKIKSMIFKDIQRNSNVPESYMEILAELEKIKNEYKLPKM